MCQKRCKFSFRTETRQPGSAWRCGELSWAGWSFAFLGPLTFTTYGSHTHRSAPGCNVESNPFLCAKQRFPEKGGLAPCDPCVTLLGWSSWQAELFLTLWTSCLKSLPEDTQTLWWSGHRLPLHPLLWWCLTPQFGCQSYLTTFFSLFFKLIFTELVLYYSLTWCWGFLHGFSHLVLMTPLGGRHTEITATWGSVAQKSQTRAGTQTDWPQKPPPSWLGSTTFSPEGTSPSAASLSLWMLFHLLFIPHRCLSVFRSHMGITSFRKPSHTHAPSTVLVMYLSHACVCACVWHFFMVSLVTRLTAYFGWEQRLLSP